MQKLTSVLAIILILSSCGSIDEEPLTETVLIAGETDQPGVSYTSIGQNYLFTDVAALNGLLVSKVAVDLDQDGQNDLEFELDTSIEEDIELLMVRSLHATMIPESINSHHGMVKLRNSTIEPFQINWTNNEWLFLHYVKANESWSAGSINLQTGFLPVQLNNQEGWLEIQLLMDATQGKVWGINLKQLAIKAP